MSSEWEKMTIDGLTTLVTKGTTPTSIGGRFSESGIPFVKVESISESGRLIPDKFAFIDPSTDELLGRSRIQQDDVLFSIAGTIGRVALVNREHGQMNTNQAVALVRPDTSLIEPRFLYYSLRDTTRIQVAQSKVVQSVQANFSLGELKQLQIDLPPKTEQKAIAHILSTLDDKIELNRKTNETLEAMAKALFKSWFVDFDPVRAKVEGRPTGLPAEISDLFPDSFEDSELGEIPSGWEVKELDEVAHFLNGLALQKFPPEDGAATLPVIKIAQLKKGDSIGADRCSTAVPSDYVVRDGDVLFSWSGSLAVDIWCGGDGALNQHLFKVTSKTYGKWFFLQWVKHHLPEFQEIAQGKATTMGHIQRHHLSEAKALIPTPSLLAAMDSVFSPLLDRAFGLRKQSKHLAITRDAFLPKLISGEMRIPDAEKMLEEVGI